MRKPPSITEFSSYPVTTATAVLAIIATAWGLWLKRDISHLVVLPGTFPGEPWRLLTTVLPHGNIFHLIFNLYWLWVFGTVVERAWGTYKTLGVYVLLAAGSSAAEFAFARGGIGLSGVGYGLFGLLWMLKNKSRDFLWVIGKTTIQIFVVWFFACILLTWWGVWNIGNIAHGSGALLGILLGKGVASEGRTRWLWVATLVVLLWSIGIASTVGRPVVNWRGRTGAFRAEMAYGELGSGNIEAARDLFVEALERDRRRWDWWRDLGRVHERLEEPEAARRALEEAYLLAPGEPTVRKALWGLHVRVGRDLQRHSQYAKAADRYRLAMEIDPTVPAVAHYRGQMLEYLELWDEAIAMFETAVELDPEEEKYRRSLENARSHRGLSTRGGEEESE